MFDRDTLISRINWSLSVLATYLKLSSGQNLNSPAVLAEDFCVGLLNLLYGYNLSNANATTANAPVVDLVDPARRLAVQITINDTTEKIRHTHRKANEHNLGNAFDQLILLFLVSKAPAEPEPSGNFTPCALPAIEVRDLSTILSDIRALDVARMIAIADLLATEIQNPAKPWNRDANLHPANLPYVSLGSLFKGRDDFLTNLHGRLAVHSATLIKGHAIHGLGGVGKTRTAVEYAWRYHSHYTTLLFVSADSPDTLDTKLAALCHADVLNLPERKRTDQTEQKAAVLTWMNTHPGWLLILDNADTEDALTAVNQLLPRLAGGHVLITSRITDYAGGIDAVALDVLPDDDAVAFLLERTADHRTIAPDDDARALELARELGGLALALEQAAAHIRKDRLSFASYLDLWHHNTAAALHWYNARTMHYPRSLAVTYQTSVDQLSDPAKEFFLVLSWFAPDPIPFFALDSEHAPGDARALLAELENLSLARRDTAGTAFSLHRLVLEITRQHQPAEASMPVLLITLVWLSELFLIGDSQDVRTWPRLEPIASHIRSVALHAAKRNIPVPTAILLNHVALFYYAKAQYAVAEPLYRQSLALYEASLGEGHHHTASALNNLATLLLATNRFVEAEPLLRKALAIWESTVGEGRSQVTTAINNLAHLLKSTNRLADAEPLMRQALMISEATLGKDHPQVAMSLNNLAQLLRVTNRKSEAERLLRQALAIDQTALEPDQSKIAIRLNNLATLLLDTKRIREAEPLLRQALSIWETTFGEMDPHVAPALNNLAQVLEATDRIAEAEPLMRRALAIDEAVYGRDHPTVAIELNNLAQLLQASNRLAEAEPFMQRVFKILVQSTNANGHPHPHLETVVGNYIHLLMELGDTKASAEYKVKEILAPLLNSK